VEGLDAVAHLVGDRRFLGNEHSEEFPQYVVRGLFAPAFKIPYLHNVVLRAAPLVPKPTAEGAVYSFNYLSATGTALLITAILSGPFIGLSFKQLVGVYLKTIDRLNFSLLTIAAMLALGFTTRSSGSDSTMGLAFASTGRLFPFFSAMLGWLGVALTGRNTSSNVLFGNLRKASAQQLGISPILTAASNSSGGVMGKMIDAQSIVVAGVAAGQQGEEGRILRFVSFSRSRWPYSSASWPASKRTSSQA
jgi:lactate permease